jgi:cytochrome c
MKEAAMMEMSKWGAAMLLTLMATAPAAAEGDAGRGKTLFSRCGACHAVNEQNKVGPHLSGVLGRRAGTVAGARYSKAMTASGMTWDEKTLDAFLTEPAKVLPGTTMAIKLPNPQDRADVIAYLKTLASP